MLSMRQSNLSPTRLAAFHRERAFTITELLVVIGIIVVLVGILLPALSAVRQQALRTGSEGTMNEFAKACDIYQTDHNNYPGVLPDDVISALPAAGRLSGTENALLALMGGYRLLTPFSLAGSTEEAEYNNFAGDEIVNTNGWRLKVDRALIGQGPLINMKSYTPYFSPSSNDVRRTKGQETTTAADDIADDPLNLPDLMDRWGQPILYFRAQRHTGPIAVDASQLALLPQFNTATAEPYLVSIRLGDMGEDQTANSLFNIAADPNATFAQIIRTPSQGAADNPLYSTPRGKYALMSAGEDGIFFSQYDGPGTEGAPVTNIVSGQYGRPEVVKEYDDIVATGGG